jgi:hypothetical protein
VTSFNLNYLQEALSPNIVTLEVRVSTHEFEGRHNSSLSVVVVAIGSKSVLHPWIKNLQAMNHCS